MKISILTQPLGRNYGGLLQAYALQVTLKRMGFIATTLDRRRCAPKRPLLSNNSKRMLKRTWNQFAPARLRRPLDHKYSRLESSRDRYISLSPLVDSQDKIKAYYNENNFDALIVGSDQVWRPSYSPELANFFFDFCQDLHIRPKRIAYAASFGVDFEEISATDLEVIQPLAQEFDAISVREDSGVTLVRSYFGLSSKVVCDPTLLMDHSDYDCLIKGDNALESEKSGKLLVYMLDIDDHKVRIVAELSQKTARPPSYLIDDSVHGGLSGSIPSNVYPSVGEWLNAFKTADYVVTDSFHGCVFALIYKKSFVAVGNPTRGMARFQSLLSRVGLSHRLVHSDKPFDSELIKQPIDWGFVDQKVQEMRRSSMEFLELNLRK